MDESADLPLADGVHPLHERAAQFPLWNFGIAAFVLLCFGLDYWLVLAANVTAHFVVRYFSLEDPQFFECFNAYWAKKDYYSV